MSRHSLKNCIRLTKGALGAVGRCDIRYGRRVDVALRLKWVAKSLRDAERQLRFAIRDVKDARRLDSRARVAA